MGNFINQAVTKWNMSVMWIKQVFIICSAFRRMHGSGNDERTKRLRVVLFLRKAKEKATPGFLIFPNLDHVPIHKLPCCPVNNGQASSKFFVTARLSLEFCTSTSSWFETTLMSIFLENYLLLCKINSIICL